MAITPSPTSCYPIGGLVTEHQAAEILGLKVSTLRRWRWSGDGVSFVKIGAAVRYDHRDLAAFIEAGRRSSTSDAGRAACHGPAWSLRGSPDTVAPREPRLSEPS